MAEKQPHSVSESHLLLYIHSASLSLGLFLQAWCLMIVTFPFPAAYAHCILEEGGPNLFVSESVFLFGKGCSLQSIPSA